MSTVVGGLRARLIRDSFRNWVRDGVAARGWMDEDRPHVPFTFRRPPANWDEEVPPNSIAISAEDVGDDDIELGSLLTEDLWTYYIDVYGDTNPRSFYAAMDCAHDIRDMLRGKIPSIGYENPAFPVYDYRQATPPILFYCQIENVILDKARDYPNAWQQNWYVIRLDVLDTYATELDD